MMADEHGYMASVPRVNVECMMTVSSQCSGCSDMSIFHCSSTTVDASEVALLRDSLESMAQAELVVA